jgi:hypothetical protein
MAENEEVKEAVEADLKSSFPEGATPEPVMSLEKALDEIQTIIKAFSVTPQVVNVAAVQFKDGAGQDILLTVQLVRVAKTPIVNVIDSYGEQFADAAERYRIFASAPSEKEGIEALMKYMADKNPAPAAEGEPEEGEPEGRTISIG